jgi:hypothetical protein
LRLLQLLLERRTLLAHGFESGLFTLARCQPAGRQEKKGEREKTGQALDDGERAGGESTGHFNPSMIAATVDATGQENRCLNI